MSIFLGVIVGRSGSKGLKNKNIKKLCGKPLIEWSIKSAKKSKLLSKIIVSTDSKKIINLAKKNFIETPFLRPKKLAKNNSMIFETLKHAIDFYKKKSIIFKYVVLIEPTSPLRESKDIDKILNFMLKKKIKTLVTLGKSECQHPNFMFKIKKNYILKPYIKTNLANKRRQEISSLFYPDGTLYVSRVDTLLKHKSFYHEETYGYILPKWKNIEIDDQSDFDIVQAIMRSKKLDK